MEVHLDHIIDQLYEIRHKLMPNKDVLEPGFRKTIEKTSAIAGSTFDEAFNTYVKYVLYKGTKYEQTRLVRNVTAKLHLKNRIVEVSSN